MTPKAQVVKEVVKLGFRKNFKSCASKTILTVKRQFTQQEKIFPNHVSDKEPISKIYTELKLNNTYTNYK
jgi:hypothetical protein